MHTRFARARVGIVAASFVGAVAICAWLVRPFDAGPASTDAAASVRYFERILSGRHLEAFVNTTPKPLLTLVYGLAQTLTDDWRPAAWLTVLALAAGIVMAAELARRVAGREAAVFAAVALVGSTALLVETSWGQGLPWAFAMWAAAGLALVRPVPRYGLAGVFLLLGALARPETLIILAVATAYIPWRIVRGSRPPPGYAWILVGWLALVVFGVHDLLLTGDPLWWTKVASIYAAGHHRGSLLRVVGRVVDLNVSHLFTLRWLVVAGVVGAIALVRLRSWTVFWGLAALGPLVAAFTLLLAARRLTVLGHYLHPIDLALIVAAAIGVGVLLAEARRRAVVRSAGRVPGGAATIGAATVLVAALVAVLLTPAFAPLHGRERARIRAEADIALRIDGVTPMLEDALRPIPARGTVPPGPYATPIPGDILLFGPRFQVNRLAVTLGVPESRVRWLDPGRVDLEAGYPPVGSVVYTDGVLYPLAATDETAALRPSTTTVTGGVQVVPVVSDPARQIWISRIEAAPGAPGTP